MAKPWPHGFQTHDDVTGATGIPASTMSGDLKAAEFGVFAAPTDGSISRSNEVHYASINGPKVLVMLDLASALPPQ